MRSLHHVAAAALALFALGCIPSSREFFAELNYPEEDPAEERPRDMDLSVSATVLPQLVVAYVEPSQAGACLAAVAAQPSTPDAMFEHGRCLARTQNATEREACLAGLPWLASRPAPARPPAGASAPPGRAIALPAACMENMKEESDQQRVVETLAKAGEATFSYAMSLSGQTAIDRPMPPNLRQPLLRSMGLAAAILAADAPAGKAAQDRHKFRVDYPVLALSGGAANGAFTAGYLHALLWLRELAIETDQAQAEKFRQALRFGASVGASVGSLVSLPIDLYFTDWPEHAPPAQRTALASALGACLSGEAGGAGPVKVDPNDAEQAATSLRRCALRRLKRDFVQNEWDLLCAADINVLDLVESSNHALGFGPLMQNTVGPFVRDFGALMASNDFVRLASVVDLNQNVGLALDERACKLPGVPLRACMEQAVLASISEPVFVPPVEKVYSGLTLGRGEAGAWLDGGLRSGTPAVRAMDLGRRRVLAINTHRAEGRVGETPENALSMIFGSLGAAVDQARQWEMAYAQLHRRDDRRRACELSRVLEPGTECDAAQLAAATPLQVTGDLIAVFVPDEIEPAMLAAAGYTFDPATMNGLFVWGQKVLLDSRKHLLERLDWTPLLQLEANSPAYAAKIARFSTDVERKVAGLKRLEDKREQRKNRERRREYVKDRLKDCGKYAGHES